MLSLIGYSQESQIGGKIGVLKSRFIPKSDSLDGWYTGFNAGVFADIKLNNWLYLSPEVLFMNRGNQEKGFIPGTKKDSIVLIPDYNGRITKTLHYIELPITLKAKYKGFYFSSGISTGFKYMERQKTGNYSTEYKFIKQEEINEIDISLINSLGYQYKGCLLELRNMYSLSKPENGKAISYGLNFGFKF